MASGGATSELGPGYPKSLSLPTQRFRMGAKPRPALTFPILIYDASDLELSWQGPVCLAVAA